MKDKIINCFLLFFSIILYISCSNTSNINSKNRDLTFDISTNEINIIILSGEVKVKIEITEKKNNIFDFFSNSKGSLKTRSYEINIMTGAIHNIILTEDGIVWININSLHGNDVELLIIQNGRNQRNFYLRGDNIIGLNLNFRKIE
jgi:hypothetical protein